MKKLILTLFVLFVLGANIFAQTTAAAFTETTKGQVSKFNQNGYAFGTTTATGAVDTAHSIASTPFGTGVNAYRNSFMGSKVLVGVNITTAFDRGRAPDREGITCSEE